MIPRLIDFVRLEFIAIKNEVLLFYFHVSLFELATDPSVLWKE